MSYLNKSIIANPETRRNAEFILNEIDFVLSKAAKGFSLNEIKPILSAYLLFEIKNNGFEDKFNYNDLDSNKLNLEEEVAFAIKESISSEEFDAITRLLKHYSAEDFALASYIGDYYISLRASKAFSLVTPESIIKLSQALLDIKSNESVADICCGMGSFIASTSILEPKASYSGYEINTDYKLIAYIKAKLSGNNIKVYQNNVLHLPDLYPDLMFDKIFSNYPFKVIVKGIVNESDFFVSLFKDHPELTRLTSSDWIFNLLLLKLLSKNGKAIGIMTNGSTWNSIDTPVRKYFVENGFIESVIALPERMFTSISIPTSLIVISRGNTKVRLVDATKTFKLGRRCNEFSDSDIQKIVDAVNNDSEISLLVDIDELRNNEYSLNFGRYAERIPDFENGVAFESVIKSITRGAPCTAQQLDDLNSAEATDCQYLMLSNIKNGIIDDELPYLTHIEPKNNKYCLKNNDLIMSKNGYPYKVAVASVKEGQKILANGNLYIIELDEEKVDPYYLKAFFESDTGIAILKSITVGATIPNIGVDKLKKIIIPLPELKKQRVIADKYRATLDEIELYRLKLNKATNHLSHIFDEESEG